MKILFINSVENDYLQDLTYAGLCEVLGKEAVLDDPLHWQYHRAKKHFWSKTLNYPHTLGFVSGVRARSMAAVDCVILACAKPDALLRLNAVLPKLKCPWVFIDGGDRSQIGGDFLRTGGEACFALYQKIIAARPPALVFKREWPLGQEQANVFPLPFSARTGSVPILPPAMQPKIQVQFWAVESSETRRKVLKLLSGKYDCAQNGTIAGQKFKKYRLRGQDYFNGLNQCAVSLSFRGEGFDTLRYWEVPACGSLLISEQPTIQIPNNFVDRQHAVFCKNDLSDLLDLIDYYLLHAEERRQIVLAGQAHLLRQHTHVKRAEYILEKVNSVILNSK